jgi:hypothetical protein
MAENTDKSSSLDLTGIGRVAEAIPPEVYTRPTESLVHTFEKLVAPITETTSGLGRYIKQKIDNMVEVERQMLTFTLEKAQNRAKIKADRLSANLAPPAHHKSFVKSLEEAAREFDADLHEMWTNLIATQLIEGACSPNFVEILSLLGPNDAHLLTSLLSKSEVDQNAGGFLTFGNDFNSPWIQNSDDTSPKEWSYSCSLLCQFGFADKLCSSDDSDDKKPWILYRTKWGTEFLKAGSDSST